MSVPPLARALRSAIGLGAIAAITAVCLFLGVNPTTSGFVFLMGVLAIATGFGLVEAVIASVVAMLCFNYYFLPPVGRFTIADPQNWVALFTFLATALVASHLSNRAQRQTMEAKSRQRETEQLYALSRAILLAEKNQSVGLQAAHQIAQIFECPAVALYEAQSGETFRGGPEEMPSIEAALRSAVMQGAGHQESGEQPIVAAITLGGHPIGALALKGLTLSDGALQALLNLVAIALERVRTEEAASRAEAARQSEEFKSTLLDAIAHEFKTPLTSIKAASTSILQNPAALTPQVREMSTIIDEETDRLSLLVTEAVHMAQIDAGKVRLVRQPVSLADLASRAVEHFAARIEGRKLEVHGTANPPIVSADPDLALLALRQIIDNALKYSPPASPIDIVIENGTGSASISVRDSGPGIPERERERVFDKFYRRHSSKGQVPGSGLGLYIAREIMRAHGGDLQIEDSAGKGTEFRLTMPLWEATHQ